MKAARIHQFGPPGVIVIDDFQHPSPGPGQVLVRVAAAGVGPWDALIREGKSVVKLPLPLTLGSDLSGIVEAVGPGVEQFHGGDAVFGVTNAEFCGAQAELALASAGMLAHKPSELTNVEAASAPVVAVTAWQMLFDYAHAQAGQTVLIHGGAGNVGAYAVQLASQAGLRVVATAAGRDLACVQKLGATGVLDYSQSRFENETSEVDIVLDTVGGETRERSIRVLKPGGILVSVVAPFAETSEPLGIRRVFFLVEVTRARLNAIAELFHQRRLSPHLGEVLPLEQVQTAHRMLAGAPHAPGKIVLRVAAR